MASVQAWPKLALSDLAEVCNLGDLDRILDRLRYRLSFCRNDQIEGIVQTRMHEGPGGGRPQTGAWGVVGAPGGRTGLGALRSRTREDVVIFGITPMMSQTHERGVSQWPKSSTSQ